MNEIGLKNFNKKYKGAKLRFKVRMLFHELRYAWQRAWIGYDDIDVFDCSFRFRDRMLLILEKYKETRRGLWWVPKESEHYEQLGSLDCSGYRQFNNEEIDVILDMMMWYLKMSDDDFVEKQLFGNNVYDDDYVVGCRSKKDLDRIKVVVMQNKKCFMELFNLFYFDLWD